MTLNPHPIHPAAGAYVLRLHRDACPAEGLLMGRIQHVTSGDWADFTSSTAMLAWLTQHAAQWRADPHNPEEPSP
ncbi:hypothetical protein [Rhodoferax ferrireducens]|uniref:hypothetical protein n=1 Tax=Rhodoferax ferrireducens TaxID=192843 RepID=UPI000E0D6B7B|nr:hypothetical protein [Rhodoferax ferrireducens]